ncbi:hypothetical protein N7495_008391 [Penicillium taxi]|uniref:uncharacterized protein n=1 Tax=Penicillium taxi TaxID=168475 RepID=UPI0025456779|nr:uncharacterized protein N7495_008391 [Penicillium taxi]KAJ5888350.1 hypothetical protein N7495_008391 [Penicillium taxi]
MDDQSPPSIMIDGKPLLERVSSLMTPDHRATLATLQTRCESRASNVSDISQSSCEITVSDFMAAKILQLEDEMSYITSVKAGLDEANNSEVINNIEYSQQIKPWIRKLRSKSSTLKVLKRQRNVLAEEIGDTMAVEIKKRQRIDEPPDEGLLERAYRDTIIQRVMNATGKQTAQKFDQSEFKKNVNEYYNVSDGQKTYCHVLALWLDKSQVKAAHLIPKSMSPDELAHIFGDNDVVTSLPQNGLSLHHKVESLLDKGDIVIIPMLGKAMNPTAWRVVVLNSALDGDIVWQKDRRDGEKPEITRVRDLDGKVLIFRNDNRPRRRYLYFRFIVSYMWQKRRQTANSMDVLAEKTDARKFWPSGGSYLQKSTLQTLARCISGCEIPDDLIGNQTFDESSDPEKDVQAGMILAADFQDPRLAPSVMDALTASMKHL